jgi:hypothetical protein
MESPWQGFRGGLWQKEINVRAFIQLNYTPYEGDDSFLAPATDRTKKIWDELTKLFGEERKKGVLDVSQIPSSITAHSPGYIDKKNEVIVGLQTDAPLKRAIMPNGGLRMVLNALKVYGYEPDPHVVEAFTKYRKTQHDQRNCNGHPHHQRFGGLSRHRSERRKDPGQNDESHATEEDQRARFRASLQRRRSCVDASVPSRRWSQLPGLQSPPIFGIVLELLTDPELDEGSNNRAWTSPTTRATPATTTASSPRRSQ